MKFLIILVLALISICHGLPTNLAPNSAENIARIASGDGIYPEELSGQFEGDMVLTQGQYLLIKGLAPKTGLVDTSFRWPNRVIPYEIRAGFFTAAQETLIRDSIAEIQAKTCIQFVARTTQTDYVYVTGDTTGCWSYVGRVGGAQQLNVQSNGCVYFGTIIHEFIHAIGFYHMQSATERDDYVTIMWDNIQAGKEHNFDKYDASYVSQFGVQYDYDSIMHYGPTSFSSNGEATIVPKDASAVIGQRNGLSTKDIARITAMYGC